MAHCVGMMEMKRKRPLAVHAVHIVVEKLDTLWWRNSKATQNNNMPDYSGKPIYHITDQQHVDYCDGVVNDERRWVALKLGNDYKNNQLNNILATKLPGLDPPFESWTNEYNHRYYANCSIDCFLNKECPHGEIHAGIRETWNDKFDESMMLYSHFASNTMINAVVRDKRVKGTQTIPRHFRAVKNGAAAMIIWKQTVGWHSYTNHNNKLSDFQCRDPALYYNFILPSVTYIVTHMQSHESDLSVEDILDVNVGEWEDSLKKKYKKYGWYSQREVLRRLNLSPSQPQHVTKTTGGSMCRGIEFHFLKVLVLLVRDFDRTQDGQMVRPRSVVYIATDLEGDEIGHPLQNPTVLSRYSRYGTNA